MARIRGVYLRKPPPGPSTHTTKEAALAASPMMTVADGGFPKNKLESVKNAASRVNSGERGEWAAGEFFAIWEYARDLVLRLRPAGNGDSSVEVLGFLVNGEVMGESGGSIGPLEDVSKGDGTVETGGWLLLIGVQPHVPAGWESVVNSSRNRKQTLKG